MSQLLRGEADCQILDAVVGLTRMSAFQRVAVAGCGRTDYSIQLHRRGFARVSIVNGRMPPRWQHSIGLIAGESTAESIGAAIEQLSPGLCPSAYIAIVIHPDQATSHQNIRGKLEKFGFRIEAGVRCKLGFVLCAHRPDTALLERAA